MLIQVTQDDLDSGVSGDPENCPVVRALKRYVSPSWRIGIGLSRSRDYIVNVGFSRALTDFEKPLLKEISEKILMIDRGRTVDPFSFEFDLPEKYWSAFAHANK